MDKPFSYLIYQQGRRLYTQNRFSGINVNDNKVKAFVLDQKNYEVKLIFNPNKILTGKLCSCEYATQYRECKHMAALYMKVMNENLLDVRVKKLRDFYEAYIAHKARPQMKDYSDFEYKIRVQLESFRRNQMFDYIKQYAEEFSKINYPSTRSHTMIEMFKDSIDSLLENEEKKEEIEAWMIVSLMNNKNECFHDYFLSLIEIKSDEEILLICNQLLSSLSVMQNEVLTSKILLLCFRYSNVSLSEFVKKYEKYENCEALYILRGEEHLHNKEYLKAISVSQEYFKKVRFPSLRDEMNLISKKATIGYDPNTYIYTFIDRLSFWNRDLSELTLIKEVLDDKWKEIYIDVYNKISKKVDSFTFEKIIHEQNEWEYAIYLIYSKPNFNHLKTYLSLIKENKPEIVESLIFECLVNNAQLANTYGSYELFLNRIESLRREIKDPQVMEYILYYLKKFNEDKPKLVDMLDEMGDKYEN